MTNDRLPTELWLDAHFKQLTKEGVFYYIIQKGSLASGLVMVKINSLDGNAKLLQQQRDLEGEMGWMNMFDEGAAPEQEVDAYIKRATERDPDLWVVEVEDRELNNPFDGKEIRFL